MCLEHHDEYDSKTSQSKGLTEKELIHYKEKLNKDFENGVSYKPDVSLGIQHNEMQIEHDRRVFEESDSILTEDDLNNFFYQLSQHFYRLNAAEKIENYCRIYSKSSNSFINIEISDSVKDLIHSLNELDEFISYKFFVEDGHTDNPRFRLQPDIKYTENKIYMELAKQLDYLCLQVRESYKKYRFAVKRCLLV